MHLAQFCPEAYKLEEGLWCFKELTGQVEMAKLTTKKQLIHYFIISEVTPNIYVSRLL